MGVDVIIVNWNGGLELIRAVLSVRMFGGRAIVVDNASTEGSIRDVASMPDVTVLRHDTNRGFSAACNTGAAAGDGEIVMLLNPDAEIITGTADELTRAFDRTGAELLGVRLHDGKDNPVASLRALPTTRDLLADLLRTRALAMRLGIRLGRRSAADEARRPRGAGTGGGWINGAATAMKRTSWNALGGMDEEFFLWYEDIDLGARVTSGGGLVAVARDLVVRHAGGASWGRISRLRRQTLRISGSVHYARKHLGTGSAVALVVAAPAAVAIGVTLDLLHFVPDRLRRRQRRLGAERDGRT